MTFERLPPVTLVDTGVFMRFLGERPLEPKSQVAREFCRAMVKAGRQILVAAPTISEIIRYQPSNTVISVPKVAGVAVVAFDGMAAEVLGAKVSNATLIGYRDATGVPLAYFKYDGLIVACALRWRADVVISYDAHLRKVAKDAGMPAEEPDHYMKRVRPQLPQLGMPLQNRPAEPAPPTPPPGPLFARTSPEPALPPAAGGDPKKSE